MGCLHLCGASADSVLMSAPRHCIPNTKLILMIKTLLLTLISSLQAPGWLLWTCAQQLGGLRQGAYTLPRWRALVWDPLRASGVPPAAAAAMLAAFGAAYNVHARVQRRAFAEEGAVAVGLANAVRCALPKSASAWKVLTASSLACRGHTLPVVQRLCGCSMQKP